MTNVLEIEKAIEALPLEDYTQLRRWLEDFELERELEASSAAAAAMLDEEDGGEDQLLDGGE